MKDDTNTEGFEELEKAASELDDVPVVEMTIEPQKADDEVKLDTTDEIEAIEQMVESDEDFDKEDLADMILLSSETYLKNFPEIQINEREANKLASCYTKLINKYLKKDFAWKYELIAVAATAIAFVPRYQYLRAYHESNTGRQAPLDHGHDQERKNKPGNATVEAA